MNADEDNVLCKGCGETLTTFLRGMADHNAEVVCPHCGEVHTPADADVLAKAAERTPTSGHH
jgi:ribosomal protein S27E